MMSIEIKDVIDTHVTYHAGVAEVVPVPANLLQ
jgi:hypothetical protein